MPGTSDHANSGYDYLLIRNRLISALAHRRISAGAYLILQSFTGAGRMAQAYESVSGTQVRTHVIEMQGGGRLAVPVPDRITQRMVIGQFYEQAMLNYIAKHFQGGYFIDCGAHIGNHSLFFAINCVPRGLWAFEPCAFNYKLLARNRGLNHAVMPSARMRMKQVALGAVNNQRAYLIHVEGDTGGTYTIRRRPQDPKALVGYFDEANATAPMSTVDLELSAYNIDARPRFGGMLIKIDVNGDEVAVIHGAMLTIERFNPALFITVESEEEYLIVQALLRPLTYRVKKRFGADFCLLFEKQERGPYALIPFNEAIEMR